MDRKITIAGLLLLALLSLGGCKAHQEVKAKIEDAKAKLRGDVKTSPVTVKVLPVSSEDAQVALNSYVGKVESGRTATLSTSNSGTMTGFSLKKGDRVAAGQTVCKVESQSVRSAYDMAKSTLDQAKDGYERLSKVYESGSVADVKMVEMQTNLAKAQAAYDAASQALARCTVKAPFAGVVGEVFASNGVEVSIASPIVQIVDINSNEIHFPVPESEFASVNVGDKASVEIPAIDRVTTATVTTKGVVASSLSHSYDCVLTGLANAKGLMPGMVCKVSLYGSASHATVIPASAVMTDNAGRYVWTVDQDGIVCKTYIEVGGYSGNGIIVEDGLPEGLRVIIEGSRKVSTGMKVNAVE